MHAVCMPYRKIDMTKYRGENKKTEINFTHGKHRTLFLNVIAVTLGLGD